MKKSLLLLLCIGLTIGGFAQRAIPHSAIKTDSYSDHQKNIENILFEPNVDATYFLTARASSDQYEQKTFFYNNQGLITAIKDSIGNEVLVIDSVFYNSNNQVCQVAGHQFHNGVWKYVYYVNYYYDEDGNLIKRTNFNSLGTETFTQGGVYDYIYENGRLVRHSMYFGDYATLGEEAYYSYNEQGQLINETCLQGFYSLDSAVKFNYIYDDEEGYLTQKNIYFFDPNYYIWDYDGCDVYNYDEYGNCIEHSMKDQNGNYTDRRLYEYNHNISGDKVSMPYYVPEIVYPEAFEDVHQRVLEHWYTLDENHVLQYICDYAYIYGQNIVGISAQDIPHHIGVFPNPAQNIINIDIEKGGEAIFSGEIYDLTGKKQLEVSLREGTNSVNISTLSSGIYILKLNFTDNSSSYQTVVKR